MVTTKQTLFSKGLNKNGFDKYSNKPVSTREIARVNLTYAVILGRPLDWLVVNYLKKPYFRRKFKPQNHYQINILPVKFRFGKTLGRSLNSSP